VILFFGVNRKNKGLAVLVDAIRQMDADVELHVAGFTGPAEWNETTQLLSSLPNVIWKHEFIDNADVPEWFKRATVVALPYTTFEAQSGVMHLAMEYGVPIVASDVGGLGETIRAWEIGIAVAPNDPKALADALSVGVSEPLNLGFRENILKSHVHLDWDTIGERFGSILLHSGTADG
jgi:glycosyltransferase involved in cell wall biosynthesis